MTRSRPALRIAAVMAVLVAATAVVAQAAGLSLADHGLGAAQAAVPTCAAGSTTVSATTRTTGGRRNGTTHISSVTVTLTACSGAAAGDTLWWELDDPQTGSVGTGSCTLSGSPAACTSTGLSAPTVTAFFGGWSFDTIDIELLATPGAAGAPLTGGNGLTLVSTYLTLTTCSPSEFQLGGGYAC